MKIQSKIKDTAKKTRFWVEVSDSRSIMLKFDNGITDEQVLAKAQEFIAKEQIAKDEIILSIDEQIAKLEAQKSILL